jgi:chemotaxis protein MotA
VSLFTNLRRKQDEVIVTLTNASKAVRSDGLGAIMSFQKQAKHPLLRDGMSLIVNDFKPEEIRHNLTARINAKQTQMNLAANLFENMSKVCPGVGMIGTLLGLIGMLANMEDLLLESVRLRSEFSQPSERK